MKRELKFSSKMDGPSLRGGDLANSLTWLLTILAVSALFCFFGYVFLFFIRVPLANLDLSGEWEFCLPAGPSSRNCTWTKVTVPSQLQTFRKEDFHGWIIYRRSFRTPSVSAIHQAPLRIVVGEVGDAAEIAINGIVIGSHGGLPPNPHYAKHYPLNFSIPGNVLKSDETENEIEITVYSLKKAQAGIRRGPVGILSASDGFRVVQARVAEGVIIPILGALGLFLLGIISFLILVNEPGAGEKLNQYVRYCCAAGLFLLSFSEIPREILPITLAGYLHFCLRLLSDWALFELVCAEFGFRRSVVLTFRCSYIAFVLLFFGLFVLQVLGVPKNANGFDTAFVVMRAAVFLVALPVGCGLVGAAQRRMTTDGKLLLALFLVLTPLQISDILVFHRFYNFTYFIKFYPFLIGLVFGWHLLRQYLEHREALVTEYESAKQRSILYNTSVEIAHDLLTPLSGLKMACEGLQRSPENRSLINNIAYGFPVQVEKLERLTRSLLSYSKELKLNRVRFDLGLWVGGIVEDFQRQSKVPIKFFRPPNPIMVSFDLDQLSRALQNLLLNAIQACSGQSSPEVRLSISKSPRDTSRTLLSVEDNGPGVLPLIRESMFAPFVTSGKENGTGLGLAIAQRIVMGHGGEIGYEKGPMGGAKFVIELPLGH